MWGKLAACGRMVSGLRGRVEHHKTKCHSAASCQPAHSQALASGRRKIYTKEMDGFPIVPLVAVLIPVAMAFAFWIWMLIECVTKEPDQGNTKICWVLIIVFAHVVGAAIYFLVRRDQRYAEVGR